MSNSDWIQDMARKKKAEAHSGEEERKRTEDAQLQRQRFFDQHIDAAWSKIGRRLQADVDGFNHAMGEQHLSLETYPDRIEVRSTKKAGAGTGLMLRRENRYLSGWINTGSFMGPVEVALEVHPDALRWKHRGAVVSEEDLAGRLLKDLLEKA